MEDLYLCIHVTFWENLSRVNGFGKLCSKCLFGDIKNTFFFISEPVSLVFDVSVQDYQLCLHEAVSPFPNVGQMAIRKQWRCLYPPGAEAARRQSDTGAAHKGNLMGSDLK